MFRFIIDIILKKKYISHDHNKRLKLSNLIIGQYTVEQTDCRTRIVDYYVDEYKQFHADVKYTGEICPDKALAHKPHHPPAPYHAPAPAPYHAPAPAPYHAPAPAPYHAPVPAPYHAPVHPAVPHHA